MGFNLSNLVTDTFESSSIQIYLETRKSIYTQQWGEMPFLIKKVIKMVANGLQFNEWKENMAEEVLGGKCSELWIMKFLRLTPKYVYNQNIKDWWQKARELNLDATRYAKG